MHVQNSSPQAILAQAKAGDPKALAQLMGGPLKNKGIQVMVDRKGPTLLISLVSQKSPPKQASLTFVTQGLQKLEMSGVNSVRVSGYQSGELNPAWVERVVLNSERSGALVSSAVPSAASSSAQTSLAKTLLTVGAILLSLAAIAFLFRMHSQQPQTLPANTESGSEPSAEQREQPSSP
jgi:hypothetical protein